MAKKKQKSGVLVALVALLLLGGAISFTKNFKIDDSNPGNIVTNVESKGVKVKKLASGTNSEGQAYVTYSYTVTPDYATNKNIIIKTLAFTDSSVSENPADFVNVTIDSSSSTFTVTQLADFSHQLTLTLAAEANIAVTCDVTIDCKQKWLGFTDETEFSIVNNNQNVTQSQIDSNMVGLVDGGYSDVYTIEIEHPTATIKSRTLIGAYEAYSNTKNAVDFIVGDVNVLESNDTELTVFNTHLERYLDGGQFSFNNGSYLKDSVNSNWSDEKKLEIKNYSYFGHKIVEDITFILNDQEQTFRFNTFLYYYTSSFGISIAPTAISAEQSQIIF